MKRWHLNNTKLINKFGLRLIWNWNGPDVGTLQMAVAWYGDIQISPIQPPTNSYHSNFAIKLKPNSLLTPNSPHALLFCFLVGQRPGLGPPQSNSTLLLQSDQSLGQPWISNLPTLQEIPIFGLRLHHFVHKNLFKLTYKWSVAWSC